MKIHITDGTFEELQESIKTVLREELDAAELASKTQLINYLNERFTLDTPLSYIISGIEKGDLNKWILNSRKP